MSISQQSKPKSSPNKLGWKAAFDPRPTRVTSALQLDCFQLRFLWVASLQATTETAGTGFTLDLRTTKLAHPKNSQLKQINAYFQSCCKWPLELLWYRMTKAPTSCLFFFVLNLHSLFRPALSLHTTAGFMLRLRQLTFRLIIVVCDISKRIMRTKCDKNYFHVTPEHLTFTEAQTSGTRMLCSLCL